MNIKICGDTITVGVISWHLFSGSGGGPPKPHDDPWWKKFWDWLRGKKK